MEFLNTDSSINFHHVPVMLREAVTHLNCRPGKIYVDCTLGGAGHSQAILERIMPDGILIGIDQDQDALTHARSVLDPYSSRIHLFHGNFTQLPDFLSQLNISHVDGILADLGISLYQIEGSGRGFSFNRDEPLDMRMNLEGKIKAEDLINNLAEKELAQLIWEYGEERRSRAIAREIVRVRKIERINSSRQFAQIVRRAVPPPKKRNKKKGPKPIHPATRTFMAIRIAVNKELDSVTQLMNMVPNLLNTGGRLCVLTFHSLEDRIVKHCIRDMAKGCQCSKELPLCVCGKKPVLKNLTRKALRPSEEEVAENPMSRSTTLRAAEKL